MKSFYPNGVDDASTRKLWKLTSLLLVFLLSASALMATHYRYGTISWKRIPGALPGTCDIEVTVKQAWRTSYPWGGTPILGSSIITSTMFATPMFGAPAGPVATIDLTVTSVNPVDDWFFGEWKDTITLPSDTGHYMLSYSGCCRISTLINNNDNSFRSESVVTPCISGNESPVSTQLPIVKLPNGVAVNTFMVAATDPDGDPLSYRLATAAESGDAFNTNPAGFSISAGGMASFSTVGKTTGDLFNAFVYIEDTVGASTMADFIIEVVDSSTPPEFDFAVTPSPASCFEVKPGDTVKFTVKASDPDVGDSVFISAVGVPIGATFTPSLPTPGGNPDSTVFMWVPDTSDIGTTVISFTAEDTSGVQASTSVCIVVSLKPIFAVPPTPAEGVHMFFECGDTIDFPVVAFDPDPSDSVQIFKVEGKSMGGSKIPLYPGAVFTPLPTPWGNPTAGDFHWEIDSSVWGHRHVFFTAKDGLGEVTEHEVSILVNKPPVFLSTPDTCVYVDSMYCYSIEVMDKDTANGDSIDLYGFGLPSWLTFVDSGNGRGSLCGTPTLADIGMHGILLEAHDVHHHETGIVSQIFTIKVKSDSIVEDTACVPVELHCPSDSSWMLSTYVEPSDWGGDWFGASALPAVGTYTLPVVIGQPYPWGGITVLDSTMPISSMNNVRFYRKEFMLASTSDLQARIRMYMDDGAEVYVNGSLLVREENKVLENWTGVPHDIRYFDDGTMTNGYMGNQIFDYAAAVDLDTVFNVGMNEVVVVIRNLRNASNKGGFSFMMDLWADCPDVFKTPVDSIVTDSSWIKSTEVTVTNSNTFPWPGATLPHDSTFILPVDIGQPYPWFSIHSAPGAYVIKAPSYTTYYRTYFELSDHVDVDTRIRAFFDDNIEVYVNGYILALEDDIDGADHFQPPYHDVLFSPGGVVSNGYLGNDDFDAVSSEDMDNVLVTGVNVLTVALRNRRPNDKGGLSLRMDVTKGGSSVLVKRANAIPSSSNEEIADHMPIQVYPNPTSSSVLVGMPSLEIIQSGIMMLTDVNGRVLYSQEITLGEVSIMELDLSNFANGVYLLSVEAGEYRDVQRVLKH